MIDIFTGFTADWACILIDFSRIRFPGGGFPLASARGYKNTYKKTALRQPRQQTQSAPNKTRKVGLLWHNILKMYRVLRI